MQPELIAPRLFAPGSEEVHMENTFEHLYSPQVVAES